MKNLQEPMISFPSSGDVPLEYALNTKRASGSVPVKRSGINIDDPKAELRVSSKTDVKDLAGAITATMKNCGYAALKSIGNGAIGIAVKASIIAKGQLSTMGINAVLDCSFFT